MKNRIGFQLNFVNSPLEALHDARALNLPFFQSFLINSKTRAIVTMPPDEIEQFTEQIKSFSAFYVHSGHLINLASLGKFSMDLLKKEIALATQLNASHLVFHLGTAKYVQDRFKAIPTLIRTIDMIANLFPGEILLENTAHTGMPLGSNILDFVPIFEKVRIKNRINFCLDTAHAYAFGYNFITDHDCSLFMQFLDNRIGREKIKLIHLNDSKVAHQSYLDRHAFPGKGTIGMERLKKIAEQFITVPLMFEIAAPKEELMLLMQESFFTPL